MCGDDILLMDRWLDENCISFLNHLSLKKEVEDYRQEQMRKQQRIQH